MHRLRAARVGVSGIGSVGPKASSNRPDNRGVDDS
jgi:hypothetical protein